MPGPVTLILQDAGPGLSTACDTAMCSALVELIDGAEKDVSFALYGYRRQAEVVDALERARARGVRVRGVVDMGPDGTNPYDGTEAFIAQFGLHTDRAADLAVARRDAPPSAWRCPGLPERKGPPQCVALDVGDACVVGTLQAVGGLEELGGIVHDKFFVIDGIRVWTGSANLSDTCTGGYNANVVAVIDVPEIGAAYLAEFEQMWAGHFHRDKVAVRPRAIDLPGGGQISAWFSPQNDVMDSAIIPAVRRAKTRIDVAAFFLTHTGLVREFLAAHARGVAITVVMDATGASNEYSKHDVLRLAGIPVRVEDWGGKMHAKAMAIDDEFVILGSMNFTSAGTRDNDENTLLIRDEAAARALRDWVTASYASIDPRWGQGRPDAESLLSRGSCSDGSDNDFDRMRDGDDPGCAPAAVLPAELVQLQRVPKGPGLVRGYVDGYRGRRYALPGSAGYDLIEDQGSVWFCSEADAKAAGYQPP